MRILSVTLALAILSSTLGARTELPTSWPVKKSDHTSEFVVQSGETNGVKLTVEMPREFLVNEPINVKFTLVNNLDEAIVLDHVDDKGDILMRLEDGHRHAVPLTKLGEEFERGSGYEYSKNLSQSVAPHKTVEWQYNLRDYFFISHIGQYRLSVLRTVDGTSQNPRHRGEDQEVDVGPVRFRVIPNG